MPSKHFIDINLVSKAGKKSITTLVYSCLDARGQNVSHWEAEIDNIVARLYGLTAADLKIIREGGG